MTGPEEALFASPNPMPPVIAVSHNHGQSFNRVSTPPLPSTKEPNFGDRPFMAVGPDGAVYLTWGLRATEERGWRSSARRRAAATSKAATSTPVLQKSVDGGKTWSKLTPVSPAFRSAACTALPSSPSPMEPSTSSTGQHPTDPQRLSGFRREASTSHALPTEETHGSKPVRVGERAGTIALTEWWIDGSLAVDPNGHALCDLRTRRARSRDTGWLSWSTDGGKRWSAPVRVDSSRTEHLTEVAAAGSGDVYVRMANRRSREGLRDLPAALLARQGLDRPRRARLGHLWRSQGLAGRHLRSLDARRRCRS